MSRRLRQLSKTLALGVLALAIASCEVGSFTSPSETEIRVPPPGASSGIWISHDSLLALPTSGAAWNAVVNNSSGDLGTANISDQDSDHDVRVLAAALVCARIGDQCQKAQDELREAVGTEGGRWLAVSRNLGAYILAADVLRAAGYNDPAIDQWIAEWKTRQAPNNNDPSLRTISPFHSGSNASAQEGFVAAAIAAYTNDPAMLAWVWDAFLTFVCDPAGADPEGIDLHTSIAGGWTDPDHPCAVNPLGSTMDWNGSPYRLDGAVGNDMVRGGDFKWPPEWTSYPWTGLAGTVPAAVVLHRAGYPAFEAADRAVLRTHQYLWFLRETTGDTDWFDGDRGGPYVQLVNHYYGTDFPAEVPSSPGMTVGWTEWTHGR